MSGRLRDDIWLELTGTTTLNSISVLTGATMVEMCAEPDIRPLLETIMAGGRAAGVALGVHLAVDIATRIGQAGGADASSHRRFKISTRASLLRSTR